MFWASLCIAAQLSGFMYFQINLGGGMTGFRRHFIKTYWHSADLLQTIEHATTGRELIEAAAHN